MYEEKRNQIKDILRVINFVCFFPMPCRASCRIVRNLWDRKRNHWRKRPLTDIVKNYSHYHFYTYATSKSHTRKSLSISLSPSRQHQALILTQIHPKKNLYMRKKKNKSNTRSCLNGCFYVEIIDKSRWNIGPCNRFLCFALCMLHVMEEKFCLLARSHSSNGSKYSTQGNQRWW